MSKPWVCQKGFTLVELMVGMVVGLIVLSAVLYSFLTTAQTSVYVRQSSALMEETHSLVALISGEIRRIGFSDATQSTSLDTSTASCLLYRYAKPNSTVGNTFGFRLQNGAVQTINSDTAVCDAGAWVSITPSIMTVTSFSFSSVPSDSAEVREVQFTVSSEHSENPDINLQISKTILLRNDVPQE